MCCKQVVHTATFRSNQTKYVIYLLECTECKTKYVGKIETEFNISLNNQRKDIWKPDAIPASCYFSGKNNNFNKHAKFILIEQIHHINIDIEKNKERLKQRENFWILTLETLTPKGLDQEPNKCCCVHHFVHLFSLPKCMLMLLNYHVITNRHISD